MKINWIWNDIATALFAIFQVCRTSKPYHSRQKNPTNIKSTSKQTYQMKKSTLVLTITLMSMTAVLYAQQLELTDNPMDTAHASAILDIISSDRGVLVPRIARPDTSIIDPAPGLLVYNTTDSCFQYFTGSNWEIVGAGGKADEPWYGIDDHSGATENSEDIYSMGKVGIGTSNISSPLSIRGNGGVYDVGITQNSLGGTATMEFTTEDAIGNQATRLLIRGHNDDSDIEFYRGASGLEEQIMHLEASNGNVGIGEINPAARLHITPEVEKEALIIGDIDNYSSSPLVGENSIVFTEDYSNHYGNSIIWTDQAGNFLSGIYGNRVGYFRILSVNTNIELDAAAGNIILDPSWVGVGIGTDNPTQMLHVVGTTRFEGDVGIGTNSPTHKLHVAGPTRFEGNMGIGTGSPTATLSVDGTANKQGGGLWAIFSDLRSKYNIMEYHKGLDEIKQFRPVSFNYKEEFDWGNKRYVGLIAQEAQKISADMVREIEVNGIDDFLELDPNELLYMLINAVQELGIQNDELKSENSNLKERIERIEKSMNL
jgi:hypothetical protein